MIRVSGRKSVGRTAVVITLCLLILGCRAGDPRSRENKNPPAETPGEIPELDIWPSVNRLAISFSYKDDTYRVRFYGKEKYTAIAEILKNDTDSPQGNRITLRAEDIDLIHEELKGIPGEPSRNSGGGPGLLLEIEYTDFSNCADDNADAPGSGYESPEEPEIKIETLTVPGQGFRTNDPQIKRLSIPAGTKLEDFLTNRLLYIYPLPVYTVQAGDTLYNICMRFYGNSDYSRITDINPSLTWPNQFLMVHPNQKILLPEK